MSELEAQPSKARDRVRGAIIEAAAAVFAHEGIDSRLDRVAAEAGVSRATLYRYFASRDDLVEALNDAAYHEATVRIREAKLDDVPFPEALARSTRALVRVGDHYIVLSRARILSLPRPIDPTFEAALNGLFERGKAEGHLRRDLETHWLRAVYRGILVQGMLYKADHDLGIEETAAMITDQFLVGAARLREPPGDRD